jgi:hypothetical protein
MNLLLLLSDFIMRTFCITHFIFIMILFHVFVLSFFVLYVESKTLRNISQDFSGTDHGVNEMSVSVSNDIS